MPEPLLRFARCFETASGERPAHCVACERSPDELLAASADGPMVIAGVGRILRSPAAQRCPATATGDHYIASYARATSEVSA